MRALRDELPSLKKWWNDLSNVYSRALQKVVERLYDNLESLKELKANGYNVGSLNWKPPREYRSFTYTQSGFKLDNSTWQLFSTLADWSASSR
jgi:putative transposase